MSKKKDDSTREAEVVSAEPEKVKVAVAPTVPARRVTFEQWSSRRSIKKEHLRGMRAFVKNPTRVRTMAEWDAAFKAY